MKSTNYVSLEKISLSEFLQRMDELPRHKIRNRKYCWMQLINEDKLTCPVTGLIVSYCSLDQNNSSRIKSKHYNFYSECGQMFTIDHVTPLSKGGHRNKIENIQPMIDIHNWEKGSNINLGY